MNAVASQSAVRGSANAHSPISVAIAIVAASIPPKYSAAPARIAAAIQ
jgi:hypothetical protein